MTRRANRGSGRPARGMDWGAAQFDVSGAAGPFTAPGYVFPPTQVRDFSTDPTVMALRVRYTLFVQAQQSATVSPIYVGFGIIKHVNPIDTVNTLPANVLPNPVTDGDMDWLLRIILPIPYNTFVGGRNGTFFNTLDTEYQSQARRRMGNDSGLLAVLTTVAPTGGQVGGTAFDFAADVRFLVKE